MTRRLGEIRKTLPSGRSYVLSMVDTDLPRGHSEMVIYAVELTEHPGVVKVGRTTKWKQRRKVYADWNLSNGDGIERELVWRITEEFVDLAAVEDAIVAALRSHFPVRYKREWFVVDIEDVERLVEQFLCSHEISYL